MISIIRIILNLFGREEIKVYRLPAVGTLRAHEMGLTIGLFMVFLNLAIGAYAINNIPIDPYGMILLALIFFIGTYIGGLFVLLNVLLIVIQIIFPERIFIEGPINIFLYFSIRYLIGYLFGAIVSILYNDFILLYLFTVRNDEIKISFVYKKSENGRDKLVNIIKSPKSGEENTVSEDKKLYNYVTDNPPEIVAPNKPFTILFIANPKILPKISSTAGLTQNQLNTYRKGAQNFEKDPIIEDLDLFIKTVDRALYCFERDEVLGKPKIWSRIRVVTIFDPDIATDGGVKFGLLEGYQGNVSIRGKVRENLIVPLEEVNGKNIDQFLEDKWKKYSTGIQFSEIDVIYFLSASLEYYWSTAMFSSGLKSYTSTGSRAAAPPSNPYTYELDPNIYNQSSSGNQEESNNRSDARSEMPEEEVQRLHESEERQIYELYAESPGKVALNVLSARQKTFIHEFAHGMSSLDYGAIVDEYFDQMTIELENGIFTEAIAPGSVNRMERNTQVGRLVRIPKYFITYNGMIYHSEMDHPSVEENWIGYFPERKDVNIGCIMDRTIGRYQFDTLISLYMYDRLIAKINRT